MRYGEEFRAEERQGSLFQPDILLSAEYFETLRRKTPLEPEKRLMLAVLEDAVASLQKYDRAGNRRKKVLYAEVREWMMERDSDGIFSFENICEVLGLDPDYLRRGLFGRREKKRQAA